MATSFSLVVLLKTYGKIINISIEKQNQFINADFARFPDADGLKYWIEKFTSGQNTRKVVVESFLISNEFQELYGENISNEKHVETLYTNILG